MRSDATNAGAHGVKKLLEDGGLWPIAWALIAGVVAVQVWIHGDTLSAVGGAVLLFAIGRIINGLLELYFPSNNGDDS